MPISRAASRSCSTARIALPGRVKCRNRYSAIASATHSPAANSRCFAAKQRLFAAGLCLALAFLLYVFLHFTRPGKAMRAVEQDREAALLMGISSEQVYVMAFIISAGLAAVGGAMLGSLFGVDPEMGAEPLLKSFIIVQIGGMGSIAGTVIAGLFIGLSDSITGTLLGGELAFIIDFAILMLILIVRPRGLFGYDVSH